uniref:Uncharacterized protein n=1 Tax=Rhizophora mucronata TaxID=61149 RepID=A0A2P2QXD7_RHIMU
MVKMEDLISNNKMEELAETGYSAKAKSEEKTKKCRTFPCRFISCCCNCFK